MTNSAGKLACKELPPPNAEGVPQGTYLGSCHGCTVRSVEYVGELLSCTHCGDGAGTQHAASLALDACDLTTIVNEQGALACTPSHRQLSQAGEPGEPGEAVPSPETAQTKAPAREASGHDEV